MLTLMLIVHVEENLWTALEVGKQLWMRPRPPQTAASAGEEQFLTKTDTRSVSWRRHATCRAACVSY